MKLDDKRLEGIPLIEGDVHSVWDNARIAAQNFNGGHSSVCYGEEFDVFSQQRFRKVDRYEGCFVYVLGKGEVGFFDGKPGFIPALFCVDKGQWEDGSREPVAIPIQDITLFGREVYPYRDISASD